jgi:hypothetical protein
MKHKLGSHGDRYQIWMTLKADEEAKFESSHRLRYTSESGSEITRVA